MNPKVIKGPTVPAVGGLIYQVTLSSGAVVTNPAAFSDGEARLAYVSAYVAETGRVLASASAEMELEPPRVVAEDDEQRILTTPGVAEAGERAARLIEAWERTL